MAVTAHFFPEFQQAMGEKTAGVSGGSQVTLSTANSGTIDTLKVGLIASGTTFTWGATPEAYTTVTQFLSGDGTHGSLTEVTYTGATPASRVTLTSVGLTTSGEVNTLTCASPSWTGATWTATYAFFYDYTAANNSDTNGLMICYWDLGGSQSVSGSTFTLTINASGLVTWTSS
jgi:hypothetical protein